MSQARSLRHVRWRWNSAPPLAERHGYWAGEARVDGEEVAVVGDEVPGRGLLVVRHHLDRLQTPVVPVGDEGGPFWVDIQLHRVDGAGAPEDLRKRSHRLVVGGDVDQVAAAVDPHTRAPDADRVAQREPPLRAVVQLRVELAVLDDQRQTLTREDDAGSGVRPTGPRLERDPPIAVADRGRQTVL